MDGPDPDIRSLLPADYLPGEVLSRRESRLVLRATRVDGGSARILKCLLPPFPSEEEAAFRREFLLLDALRHPCWVRPLRFGSLPGGGIFLEMEEAAGLTLSRWPIRGWWPETLSVARQVLSGLEVLHRLGYAHLDLGPEQLLVESTDTPTPWEAGTKGTDGAASTAGTTRQAGAAGTTATAGDSTRVRLLDLGLAAPFGAAVGARGTPGSIAPELLRSLPGWDARADLYSIGTILFELFTGQPAFPGRTVRDVLALQLEGPEPDPGDEAGLPPPVRDLVRELLARDPAGRPRSAPETWQRLREQAPRATVGGLPPFLVAGDEFAFIGRDDEIGAFEAWLSSLESASRAAPDLAGHCELTGEEGIGRRRLAERMGAVAESRGWVREGATGAPVFRHRGGATVRISVGAQMDVPAPALSVGGTALRVLVEPMPAETLARILAAAGIESEVLRRRLAESCLGSPGLLAGFADVLPREIDLAVRYTGEERLDATLDGVPLPAAWLAWARRLLGVLSPADGALLLRAGVAGLPGMPEGVALGPPDIPATIDPMVRRGLLHFVDHRWRARTSAWARAIVGADAERTTVIGHELLARLDHPGDELARARLGLLLHDTDAVAAALPGGLRTLARLGRREEAVCLHAEAARLGREALRDLQEEDILELLEGLYGMGTGGGGLLHEPTEWADTPGEGTAVSDAAGTSSARALLATWAWLGRRRPVEAAAALHAAELLAALHLRPDSGPGSMPSDSRAQFFHGWLQLRLFQAQADADGARRALAELRRRVSPGDLRRQAWCDGAEVGILEREGRFDDALVMLEAGRVGRDALEAGEQATYLYPQATIRSHRGELHEAAEILARVEMLWRHSGFTMNRLHAAASLGIIACQEGKLAEATAWNEDLLRDWAARRRWDGAVSALINLAQNLLERGRLGEALRAAEDAGVLAERAMRPLAGLQAAVRRIHLLACAGLLVRVEEEAVAFLSTWSAPISVITHFARFCFGTALFAQGRPEEGALEFRQAVNGSLAANAADDVAETLAHWGLAEMAAGRIADARDRLAEIEPVRQEVTELTRSTVILLEAEIALTLTSPGISADALSAAKRAVAILESQERWFLAWRAHWCLARAQTASGQAREAVASYGAARTILTGIVESLGTVARTDGFLRLPAVSTFLKDLRSV
jgi:tetratricopeptide (TPR) repeat protein